MVNTQAKGVVSQATVAKTQMQFPMNRMLCQKSQSLTAFEARHSQMDIKDLNLVLGERQQEA